MNGPVWTRDAREGTQSTMRAHDLGEGASGSDAVQDTERQGGSSQDFPTLPALPATLLGWLTAASTAAGLLVDFPGNRRGAVAARSTIVLDDATISRAIAIRQPVTLVFENGDAGRPIVLGLLQGPPSPLEDLLRGTASARNSTGEGPRGRPVEARVDGRRVTISADDEITLKCGEAAVTLRRDGKILLRGAYVETYASGTNRIKGAQVKIN